MYLPCCLFVFKPQSCCHTVNKIMVFFVVICKDIRFCLYIFKSAGEQVLKRHYKSLQSGASWVTLEILMTAGERN